MTGNTRSSWKTRVVRARGGGRPSEAICFQELRVSARNWASKALKYPQEIDLSFWNDAMVF